MSVDISKVVYSCDWTLEDGETCAAVEMFAGHGHSDLARAGGWGWYANAHIRWNRYETGMKHWYCPVHATQFRNNHGWGGLEDYGPPKKWWKDIFK